VTAGCDAEDDVYLRIDGEGPLKCMKTREKGQVWVKSFYVAFPGVLVPEKVQLCIISEAEVIN
jgi:hypothetical protein